MKCKLCGLSLLNENIAYIVYEIDKVHYACFLCPSCEFLCLAPPECISIEADTEGYEKSEAKIMNKLLGLEIHKRILKENK